MSLKAAQVLRASPVVNRILTKAQLMSMRILAILWHSCFHPQQHR